MRMDGTNPISPDVTPEVDATEPTLDAAVSLWDPWLWALYLRELEIERVPALH